MAKKTNQASQRPDELATAIALVSDDPNDASAWDRLEEVLERAQRPADVAPAFNRALAGSPSPALVTEIGQRGVRFFETWYGDGSAELVKWLERVLELDPRVEWAFERLTVAHTVSGRFGELLDAYDRAIAAADQTVRRMKLLDEAAQIAKDFANQPDRAIGYLSQLHGLDPDNAVVSSVLERLLERQERWADLVALFASRLELQPENQARESRLRIATIQIERLGDEGNALAQIKQVLASAPDHKLAYELLTRIVGAASASPGVRHEALGLLRQRLLEEKRVVDLLHALELALVSANDERSVLRELVERSIDSGDDARAAKHQAALLVLDPLPKERETLRALATRTRDFELLASALVRAADASQDRAIAIELRMQAARVCEEQLREAERAVGLYAVVFDAGASEHAIEAGRRLAALLERTDRAKDTLDVLARLSELEPEEPLRRVLLGKLARLAEQMGDRERAENAWRARMKTGDEGDDIEALDALVSSAEQAKDYKKLAELLERRASSKGAAERRRADLVWLSRVLSEELSDLDGAVGVWRRIQEQFGEDMESLTALTDLLSRAERWQDLADVLSQAAARQIARFTELQTRLGDAYRERLDHPELAAERYRSALQVNPRDAAALKGQRALLEDPRCRGIAVKSLADAYQRTGAHRELSALLEARLSVAGTEAERAEILAETARLHEQHDKQPEAALACYARAFALAPDDRALEREVRRLSEQLGAFAVIVQAYRDTIARFSRPSPRMAELRHAEGVVLEERLSDLEAAYGAYAAAAEIAGERVDLVQSAVRVAVSLGRFADAAKHAVRCMVLRKQVEPELLELLEHGASAHDAFAELTSELTASIAAHDAPAKLACELHGKVASYAIEHLGDLARAEQAFVRATQADPDDVPSLRALIGLLRRAPGEALCAALERLAALLDGDLDPLLEAAKVALDRKLPFERARELLEQVHDRASLMLRRGITASGKHGAAECLRFALDALVERLGEHGEHAAALGLLLNAITLPLDAASRREDLRNAAAIAHGALGDQARATALYRDLLALDPQDAQARTALATLYSSQDRLPELLTLRRDELAAARDDATRIELRLEVARVLAELETRGGREDMLMQNLRASPGHGPTIEALSALLDGRGRHAQLAQLLCSQARLLVKQGEKAGAAELLELAAVRYERELRDVDSAISVYRELHELFPEGEATAQLARLHAGLGQHVAAAKWLEVRLETALPDSRAITAVELGRAHLEAGQRERARGALERALREDPSLLDARELLARIYREDGSHEPLAGLLSEWSAREANASARLALLREAATLYYDTLRAPERAVDVLQRAVNLAPDDRNLGLRLADALLRAGRHSDARAVLEGLIEGYGRKRSPERAELHFQLARVLSLSGEGKAALEQLETATKMDSSHIGASHMLAQLSQQAGDLDRAERVYRGLLMLVRRQVADAGVEIGSAEIFYELCAIAKSRGQAPSAAELMQSAMEAATQHEIEAKRFQALLKRRGESELLMRLLDARLALASAPSAQADVLAAKAEALAAAGQGQAAVDAVLRALALDPAQPSLSLLARQLANKAQVLDRYLDAVSVLVEELSRKRDPESKKTAAWLLLRAGEAVEQDLRDLDRAAGMYARVEASGEHVIDAFMAMARVAGARGDEGEQRRVLLGILELSDDRISDAQRRDALFTLAEIELSNEATRDAGVKTLERALHGLTDVERGKEVLRAVSESSPDHDALAQLFERVARSSHDQAMLLEHFERHAARASSSAASMREGIELALRIGQHARAEALLLRAEKKLEKDGERAEAWLLSGLSDCRLGQGDLRGAIGFLARAVEVADEAEIEELCRELARLASGPEGDPDIAWLAYERLIERRGLELALVEPLLELHARTGNRERLEELATRVAREATAANERVVANMALAMFLIDSEGDGRSAVPALRAVLQDDPARTEARALLSSIYQQQGMHDELAELLQEQFDRARDEQNLEAIADIGLQIGSLYGDRRRDASIDAYRAALEWAPKHVGLLRALLGRLGTEAEPRERAEVLQALLAAEEGADASARALELHAIWQQLDEPSSARAALETGLARDPDNVSVRELLEATYAAAEDWRPLAELFERDAQRIGKGPAAVGRLKNAATLYREQLDDLGAASDALRKALEIVPDDLSLSGELARNLAAAGRHAEAIEDLSRLLDAHPAADTVRVDLLRVRAELYLAIEELAQGVKDLEEAYGIAPQEVRARLVDALERQKSAAFTEGAPERERACVYRLVALHEEAGHSQLAREVLAEWVEQDPQDIESLRALLARDQAQGRHADVIASCSRLLRIEPAQARAKTAMTMAEAAKELERPELAREGLEVVYQADPSNAQLRARLRDLYEALGERAALAGLLLADAADKPKNERPELLQRAAQLYLEMGDAESALGPLKEAAKLDPDAFATQLLMVDLNIKLGRLAQADDALETAINVYKKRRTPELGVLYQRKGRLAAAQGDVAEQIRWLNQAMEADRKSGELAADLAEVSMNAGDYDTAMKALRMLTMMDDPSPMSRAVAFLRQAQIAYLRGDPRRAQHWARKAKSLDDANTEVDRFLAEIGAA